MKAKGLSISAPITRVPIISGQNGPDWVATKSIDGEFHEYNLGTGVTSGNNVIGYDFNPVESPGGSPVQARSGPISVGLSTAEGGDDKISGYDNPLPKAGSGVGWYGPEFPAHVQRVSRRG